MEQKVTSLLGFSHKIKKNNEPLFSTLNKLKSKNNYSGFLALLLNYSLISLVIFLFFSIPSVFTYFLLLLVVASRMRALENLLHEASHGLLFRNASLNYYMGMIFCAFPIGSSFYAYQSSHMKHHRYLGDPDRDPDLIRYRKMHLDQYPTAMNIVLKKMISVFLLLKTFKYIQGTFFTFIYVKGTPKKEIFLRLFLTLNVLGCISFFHQWSNFFLIWGVPFLSVFQMIRFFAEVSEHGGLYKNENQIEMTRNNLVHPVIRFFLYPHGDAYHLTHHLIPGIPHYHLPVAHHFLMTDEEYAKAHHCFGYFFQPAPGALTAFSELVLK